MQGEFELITNACICTTNNPGKKYIIDVAKDEIKKKYKSKKQKMKKVEHKVSRKN